MSAEFIGLRCAGEINEVAGVAYTSGEVIQLADGRAAIVANLVPVAIGEQVTFQTVGIGRLASATGTTFAKGAPVYWDASANVAITTPGADADFYVGTAVAAKVSGNLNVLVELNQPFTRGLQALLATREVLLDHADTVEYIVVTAAENPNGMLVQAFTGIVTEAPAGSSEDQLILGLYDEDDNQLSTLTTTDTTPDAAGDIIVGTLSGFAAATGAVYAVIPAGKAAYVKVAQATVGTPAGAVKVHAILLPRW